jgi:hypothetical protein
MLMDREELLRSDICAWPVSAMVAMMPGVWGILPYSI